MHKQIQPQVLRQQARVKIREALSCHYSGAVFLCLFVIAMDIGILCAGRLTELFFQTLLIAETPNFTFWTSSMAEGICMGLLVIGLLFPLQLGIKGWYVSLDEGPHSLRGAFAGFFGIRSYLYAVGFSFVRHLAACICFLFPQIPTLTAAGILYTVWKRDGFLDGALYGILILLLCLLALLGICFFIYFFTGLFLADYLYVCSVERNPFRAMSLSFRRMQGCRRGLLVWVAQQIPFYLLSLTVAGAPFAMPRIRCAYAAYAAEIMAAEPTPDFSGRAEP